MDGSFQFIKNPGFPEINQDDVIIGTEVISVSPGKSIKIILLEAKWVWLYVPDILGWTYYSAPGTVVIESDTVELTTWLELGGRYVYTWVEVN